MEVKQLFSNKNKQKFNWIMEYLKVLTPLFPAG